MKNPEQRKQDHNPEIGVNSSRVFSGENKSQTTVELYGESPQFIANIFKQKLKPGSEYSLADLGSHQGELMKKILELLPGYKFHTIGIEHDEKKLSKNEIAQDRIIAEVNKLPLKDRSIDVAFMRYVMQWNYADKQKQILKEISRIISKFALIQHVGSDNKNTEAWREKINELLSGKISKLKRKEQFFSSRDEIEAWMKEQNISFERIQDRRVEKLSNAFVERYELNAKEKAQTQKILGDKDFAVQSSWLIYPNL